MRAVIVYESMYGNTREIAEAIAEGVHDARPDASVSCLPVAEAGVDVTRTADLLVVGGPTHMHGMSSRLSRKMAATAEAKKTDHQEQAEEARAAAESPGLRTWFHHLPDTEPGTHAAAFDTRAAMKHAGGAAEGIAHRLSHHHYDVMVEPEGFLVDEADGPLQPGELERAKTWGAALV